MLREGLVGNRINYLYGILGNLQLHSDSWRKGGVIFRGFSKMRSAWDAEAEALDVDGFDAMHKAGLLGSLLWLRIPPDQIHVEGIRQITPGYSIRQPTGYTIKLLATIRPTPKRVQISVCPTLIPLQHVLAGVRDVFNAVYIGGDVVETSVWSRSEAGCYRGTVSDLADAALDLLTAVACLLLSLRRMDRSPRLGAIALYLRLHVVDRPGTMARITAILAEATLGSHPFQPEGHEGMPCPSS